MFADDIVGKDSHNEIYGKYQIFFLYKQTTDAL